MLFHQRELLQMRLKCQDGFYNHCLFKKEQTLEDFPDQVIL